LAIIVASVVSRLGRLERDRQLLLGLLLPDELDQPVRPQLQLERGVLVHLAGGDQPFRLETAPI
jgi:hypothetical protein